MQGGHHRIVMIAALFHRIPIPLIQGGQKRKRTPSIDWPYPRVDRINDECHVFAQRCTVPMPVAIPAQCIDAGSN